jgi:hypothetical protein
MTIDIIYYLVNHYKNYPVFSHLPAHISYDQIGIDASVESTDNFNKT